MAFKIIACESAWQKFVQRAKKAYPKEHIEAIWGIEMTDSFRITDFKRIKLTSSTHNSLDYDDIELKRQVYLAKKEGKSYLGTVHTHPGSGYDTSASATDHHKSIKEEKIMGVVVIYKKKDSNRFVIETDWWQPQPKMQFELLPD